jgi:hypothetical protein
LPLCLQLKQSRSIGSDRGYASKETSNWIEPWRIDGDYLDIYWIFSGTHNEKELYEALLKLLLKLRIKKYFGEHGYQRVIEFSADQYVRTKKKRKVQKDTTTTSLSRNVQY